MPSNVSNEKETKKLNIEQLAFNNKKTTTTTKKKTKNLIETKKSILII